MYSWCFRFSDNSVTNVKELNDCNTVIYEHIEILRVGVSIQIR